MPRIEYSGEDRFEPIPSAFYAAYVNQFKRKENTDGEYYSVMFTVAEDHQREKGRTVWTNLFFGPDNSFKTVHLLVAAGILKKGERQSFDWNEETMRILTGKKVRINVSTQTYDGIERNDVKDILPLAPQATAAPVVAKVAPRL